MNSQVDPPTPKSNPTYQGSFLGGVTYSEHPA